jgi:hypothetical protein
VTMRVAAAETQVALSGLPAGMAQAWHVDAHLGTLPRRPAPAELVSALFLTRTRRLVIGEGVRTSVGQFVVEACVDQAELSRVVMRINAPRSVSRVCISVLPSGRGDWDLVFHHSLHPSSWVGRAYFRLIEPFHHVLVELALRWAPRRLKSWSA